MKTKPQNPAKVSDAYLSKAIQIATVRGGQTLLAKKLSELTGKTILRQAIQSWTRAKARISPSLGIGLKLAEAAVLVEAEMNKTQNQKG